LKEEALDRTLWRIRFGRGYGPVVRQATEWMNIRVSDWFSYSFKRHHVSYIVDMPWKIIC
jgi:hypothetical protein